MAWYDDPTIITLIVASVVIIAVSACVTVLYAMRHKEKKPPQLKPKQTDKLNLELSNSPFSISKSVQATTASSAKDELRILDLEREILSD